MPNETSLIILLLFALTGCEHLEQSNTEKLSEAFLSGKDFDNICRTTNLEEQSEIGFKFSCDGPNRSARFFVWRGGKYKAGGHWEEVLRVEKGAESAEPSANDTTFKNNTLSI